MQADAYSSSGIQAPPSIKGICLPSNAPATCRLCGLEYVLTLSEPQFPYLEKENNSSICLKLIVRIK